MEPVWNFPFQPFDTVLDGTSDWDGTECHPEFASIFQGRNTYICYLKCQTVFVTWLVKAAARLGEHVQTVESLYEIPVPFNQLIRLAEVVSRRGSVSHRAFHHLEYILKVRGEWDPRNEIKPNPDSNHEDDLAHWHFCAMSALRTVRGLLKLAPMVLDGCEENTATDTYCLAPLPGEAFFAWVCFFNDLFSIRSYLKTCWKSYLESRETLTTMTLATNTAIRLIRANCEAQLKATAHLPDMPTEYGITEWIGLKVVGEFSPLLPGESWRGYEASWCCLEAHNGLVVYATVAGENGRCHDRCIPIRSTLSRDVANFLASHADHGPERERGVSNFVLALCLFLHNLKVVGWDENNPVFLPCLDELTSGWMQWEHYLDPNKIPLWLTVSFQICADISLVLGRYSPTALDDLKENGENKAALFSNYVSHVTTQSRRQKGEDSLPRFLSTVRYLAKCVRNDNYAKATTKNTLLEDPHIGFSPHELHPLLCGMQSWWLEQRYRSFQFWAVKLNESITPAALLYVSMRKLGLVGRWMDMECVCQ
ncbi:hypothetical protein F5X98DRAFT_385054 [Xylaria grammica]|nr:hypothetical protein F5X98DRAFT_385054 [Xylaria grammica]